MPEGQIQHTYICTMDPKWARTMASLWIIYWLAGNSTQEQTHSHKSVLQKPTTKNTGRKNLEYESSGMHLRWVLNRERHLRSSNSALTPAGTGTRSPSTCSSSWKLSGFVWGWAGWLATGKSRNHLRWLLKRASLKGRMGCCRKEKKPPAQKGDKAICGTLCVCQVIFIIDGGDDEDSSKSKKLALLIMMITMIMMNHHWWS